MFRIHSVAAWVLVLASAVPMRAAAPARPRLAPADIDAIVELVKLEDTRRFDEATLARLLRSAHPEVRRRAVLAVGRIVDPRGRALLVPARGDADLEVAATVAFATGQLKDPGAVAWLGDRLSARETPPAIAREAACALGKIRSPEARAALARYLTGAPATSASAAVVGETLLALGRFTTPKDMPREDIAPIVRWTTSKDAETRWRAAWALFRPRDPAAVPTLLTLADDKSGDVRFWAVRGLTPAVVDGSSVDRARASAKLRDAVRDPDRRVRTEALRALAAYEDDASLAVAVAALDSPDTWLSVSAAEVLGLLTARADAIVPKLIAAVAPGRPLSVRLTALASLRRLAPDAASAPAAALAADPDAKALLPQPAGAGRGGGARGARPARVARTDADYRRIVDRWIVPDYNGAAKPRAILETPRGQIEIELYPGDAPFGVEYFVRVVESGAVVGTAFGRVVPNFVAQQQAIADDAPLRDEVNRHGLTRGNLSWASAGLDTGRPGYTLGSTPQPHNEGDFTALGRVVRGLDVVDHLELGDRITAARMRR
jgi:HEAT repeat protein/cyclophilin family peptidyl-prolyl cis-trans isomerase